MDEPASALSEREREHLFSLIEKLRDRNITIIYVSHSLEEVFRVASRATVLKDGKRVCTKAIHDTNPEELITFMVGRKLERVFPPKAGKRGDTILTVNNLESAPEVAGVSFSVREGEILGIYGLVGAGRTELCKSIFGARPYEGEILVNEKPIQIRQPSTAVNKQIAFLSEDRKTEGLVMGLSIRRNMALPSLSRRQVLGVIDRDAEKREARSLVEKLKIVAPSVESEAFALSGGNQQKVVIGKWLLADPRVLICDEPTRGVDVGAKMEIYSHLRNLAEEGMAVIMVSSELPEILGMSDRILVLRKGRISAEFEAEEATEEKIMASALGGSAGSSEALPETAAPSHREIRIPVDRILSPIRSLSPSDLVVYLTLLALFGAGILSSGSFLDSYNLTSIIRHATALGIVSMGQAMVMISGGVDLSVSSTITLTTILSAGLMAGRNAMILPAVMVCLAVGVGIGMVNGFSVVKLRITPFIATLGVMSIGRGAVLLITHGPLGSIGPGFRALARGALGPFPSALIIILFVFILAILIMNRSVYGRHLFAMGGDREVTRLAGINVPRLEFSTYIASGVCAVAAGLYLTSRMGVGDPSVGPGFELDSIIAVLIGGIPFGGGRGNVLGVVAGVLLMSVLGNLLTMWNLHSWYHQIARAVILLAAISIIPSRPSGAAD